MRRASSSAHRLGAQGLTVNAICPGWTRTGMALGRFAEPGLDEVAGSPRGRITEPEAVAVLALWLASPAAAAMNAQALTLDGGESA